MAILLSTDFNTPNQSGWPSPWTVYQGSAEVNLNRGRIISPEGTWANASTRSNLTFNDGVLTGTVSTPTLEDGRSGIDFRYNPLTGNGYRLLIGWYYGGLELQTVSNWQTTSIASAMSNNWQQNTTYRFKLEAFGANIRCKVWFTSAEEPAEWQINHSDSVYSTGDLLLRSASNGTGNIMVSYWDDLLLSDTLDTEAPAVILSVPTPQGQTPGYEHVYGTVLLSAEASDDIGIQRVSYYTGHPNEGGVEIDSVTANEYQTQWDTTQYSNGLYQLHAIAFDVFGKETISSPVEVMVNNSGAWTPKNGRAWPVNISIAEKNIPLDI